MLYPPKQIDRACKINPFMIARATASSAGFVLPSPASCIPKVHLHRLPHASYTAPRPWSSSWQSTDPFALKSKPPMRRCRALRSKGNSNNALPRKPWLPFLALMGVESALLGPFLDDFHGRTGVLVYRDPISIDMGSLHILGSAAWVSDVLVGWGG